MLYIIFNSDGSIKELIVGESIQQGDHLTKQIFTKVEGISTSDYVCTGDFTLPTGEISQLVAETANDTKYGSGYSITLTEAQTLYAGEIKLNLKLVNLQGHVLCTYQTKLVINPTGYDPDVEKITQAQYNSLLQSLNSYLTKVAVENMLKPTLVGAALTEANAYSLDGGENYNGCHFDLGSSPNGFYLFTYANVIILLFVYDFLTNTEYKISGCLCDENGSYETKVLTYGLVENSGNYRLIIYNKQNFIPEAYTAYLYKIALN